MLAMKLAAAGALSATTLPRPPSKLDGNRARGSARVSGGRVEAYSSSTIFDWVSITFLPR